MYFVSFVFLLDHKLSILYLRSFVSSRKIACLALLLVCLLVSFNSLACYRALLAKNLFWEGILLMFPNSLTKTFAICVHHIYLVAFAIPSKFPSFIYISN